MQIFDKKIANFANVLLNFYQNVSGFFQIAATFGSIPKVPRRYKGVTQEVLRDRYQFRRTLHAPRCPVFSARSYARP